MGSDSEAQAAITGMNGQSLGGRSIVVNEARPMEQRPRGFGGSGGGGGGGGGYGGGGGGGGRRRRRRRWWWPLRWWRRLRWRRWWPLRWRWWPGRRLPQPVRRRSARRWPLGW